MNKRMQLSLALALAAPAWLVAGYAVAQESPQTEQQLPQQQMQDESGSQLMNMTAGQVAKLELKNDQGQEIGDIDKIVKSKDDGKLNAVVAVGGFLGLGEKQIAVPLDQLRYQQGELVAQGMTKDQLEQQQAYNDQQYDVVEEGTTLASAAGQAQPGGGTELSFQQLDQNQDGNITPDEAQSAPQLSENWQQYDTNQDGQLDQSEFSAFEQQQQQEGGQQQMMEQGGEGGQQMERGGLAFSDLDQNGDGRISRDEVREVKQLSENWTQYDTNSDDALDQSEFAAFEQEQQGQQQPGQMEEQQGQQPEQMQQSGEGSGSGTGMSGGEQLSFQQLDQNQDGSITKEEAQSAPELSQNWQQYDTNQDGQLDQSEFSAFEQEYKGQQQEQMQQMMPQEQMHQEQPGQTSPMTPETQQ